MNQTSSFTVNDIGVHIASCDAVGNTDAPSMLYHYTSLSSLALILKNRTLRLMPISNMDDKQEKRTRDVENLGRFFFVSCWTDYEEESIPMWNMYASLDSGVRIGLPPNPFARHLVSVDLLCERIGFPEPEYPWQLCDILLRQEDIDRGVFCIEMGAKSILHKVEYVTDRDKLVPSVAQRSDSLVLGDYGTVKHKGWEFQREWRYILWVFPPDPQNPRRTLQERMPDVFEQMKEGTLGTPYEYFDLSLSEDAISRMEIIPSPEMDAGNRVLFDALVEKYCPEAYVMESELRETL